MTDETLADRLAIRDVVESWAIARDSADWDRFRAQWHDDGYMMATWFQGPKEDFIRVSQEGFAKGVNILHFTGASQATVNGTRAISQTPDDDHAARRGARRAVRRHVHRPVLRLLREA